MLSPGASALDRPAKAKPARFVPHWGGSKKTAASAYHHQVLSSTTLSMKTTYLSPKNQLLPKTFANKPLLPPPLAPPRFAGEKPATTTSAAANKENQEDQEMAVPPPSRTGADHIERTAPNTEEAPPRRSPRKNAYEVLQSKIAGGSDDNKKASKKVVKKRPQVAQKSQAKAPTVKQTLVYETVGPDKVVKTAVKRTHKEQQGVLFSDDEVCEDDSSKAKKAKEGAESVKGQPQEAEAGEKKKRPPKVYANRTLTSFSKSPTKQKRQLTNKKTAAVKAWETLQTSHFDDIDDVDLTFA